MLDDLASLKEKLKEMSELLLVKMIHVLSVFQYFFSLFLLMFRIKHFNMFLCIATELNITKAEADSDVQNISVGYYPKYAINCSVDVLPGKTVFC